MDLFDVHNINPCDIFSQFTVHKSGGINRSTNLAAALHSSVSFHLSSWGLTCIWHLIFIAPWSVSNGESGQHVVEPWIRGLQYWIHVSVPWTCILHYWILESSNTGHLCLFLYLSIQDTCISDCLKWHHLQTWIDLVSENRMTNSVTEDVVTGYIL